LKGQQVIIFGGKNETVSGFSQEDSIYNLELNNFKWSIPKVSGKPPRSRHFHTANRIGSYMVIAFGKGYDQNTMENDVLLLEISDTGYSWTTEFNPFSEPQSYSIFIIGGIVIILLT
ncbi:3217_t:CDS:2, partial [Funneliformis caledonium]